MKNKDKKLKVDLDFLDEKSSKPKQRVHNESTRPSDASSSRKWNWKTISIVVGIIVVVFWLGASEDNSPSSTSTPTNNSQVKSISADDDSVEYGEYRCSQHHYDKAVSLSPSKSETALNTAQLSMDNRANELERLERNIEYSYVNEYSEQWEIDNYNDEIYTYNSKLASYKRDAAAHDTRIDRFNSQIEVHNKYLAQNCTPR